MIKTSLKTIKKIMQFVKYDKLLNKSTIFDHQPVAKDILQHLEVDFFSVSFKQKDDALNMAE